MGNNIVYILRQIKQLRYVHYITLREYSVCSMYPTLYKELGDNSYILQQNKKSGSISNF